MNEESSRPARRRPAGRWARRVSVWALALGAGGCASAPRPLPPPTPGERAAVEVTVLSDGPEGERVAERLRGAGYAPVRVRPDVHVELGVLYGGAAPSVVDELARLTAGALDVDAGAFRRARIWPADDLEVYLHVASSAVCLAQPGCTPPDPAPLRQLVEVYVFTDVAAGETAKRALEGAGYPRVSLEPKPNETLNAKYGAAPLEIVREVLETVARATGCPVGAFDVRKEFAADDDDVFVNLGARGMMKAGCGGEATQERGAPEPTLEDKGFVRVFVFSDGPEAERVAERLRALGYPRVETRDNVDVDLNIRSGGASDAVIEHILAVTGETLAVEPGRFRRARPWPDEDGDVYLNVASSAVCAARPDCTPPDPAPFRRLTSVRVVSDAALGRELAAAVRAKGYPEVEVRAEREDPPPERPGRPDLAVRYGAAPIPVVREVAELAVELTGCPIERFLIDRALPAADARLVVELSSEALRAAECPAAPALPAARVVLFTETRRTAMQVTRRLRAEGFEEVETNRAPDDALGVKLGPGTEGAGPILRAALADELGVAPDRVRLRDDIPLPAGEVFVDLPEARIPPRCGQDGSSPDYGAISVGAVVRLRRHRVIAGTDNWSEAMTAFVGRRTRVRSLEGVDGAGCPVVTVEADDGRYVWRARDLVVVSSDTAI